MGFNTNKKITDADMHHIADEAAKLAGTSVTYEDEILYFATGSGGGSSGGGGSFTLLPARRDRLGGVIIGDNMNISDNGTITHNGAVAAEQIATDAEADEMLGAVFN